MIQKEFIYDVSVNIEMSFSDFDMLFRAAETHYDHRVKESTTQGFFMFGNRNRRNWALDDDKNATSFEATWTTTQLNLMRKALEMTRTEQSFSLSLSIRTIFNSIQDEYQKLNNQNNLDF